MDLQALNQGGRGWSWTKIAAFLCFAAACALLVGSLSNAPAARAAWAVTSIR